MPDLQTQNISEIILQRIHNEGANYNANQNISRFICEGELGPLKTEVAYNVRVLLRSLLIDIDNDPNSMTTDMRVAKMLVDETFSGHFLPAPRITNFPNKGYQSLYTTSGITIRSTCSHHLQPITGKCWVGIFPEVKVIGLSKFNRIVDWIASRPQIQEEMTTMIADALVEYAETPNVAVIIKAQHGCMTMRGVKESCGEMSTAVMLGRFQTDTSLKDEFYKLIGFSRLNT